MTATTPNEALAAALVDELARSGIRRVCIAPGSRSTPMVLALSAHELIEPTVAVDERSAAFLALGMAKASGVPGVVVSTSGTAAANFHPAVEEANHSRTPLILLTADRPPELRDTGANQTIDQIKMFGDAVRWFVEVGVADGEATSPAYWRSVGARSVLAATAPPPGPVHLNLAFREPLVPDGSSRPVSAGRADGRPWCARVGGRAAASGEDVEKLARQLSSSERGVVVLGETRSDVTPALELAAALSWPVLADPLSGGRRGHAISTYDVLLRSDVWKRAHQPDVAVRIGRPGTSKALTAALSATPHEILIDEHGSWLDPARSLSTIVHADPEALCLALLQGIESRAGSSWLDGWLAAEEVARRIVDSYLDHDDEPSEPRAARDVARAVPVGATLAVASSMPVRDLEWFMQPRDGLHVLGNRGASGIDGFVSTALGAAIATSRPVVALTGDLSLIHDQNGLVSAGASPVSLTFVVLNNGGGGIFSFLPQRDLRDFERLFTTPHGLELERLANLYRCDYRRLERASELEGWVQELSTRPGLHMIEVPTDRKGNVRIHAEIWKATGEALESGSVE